jgi:hypothetical protein
MIPTSPRLAPAPAIAGVLAGFAWTGALAQAGPGAARGPLTPGTTVITGVAMIPMTLDTVIRDATVLVRDGRIVSAGPAGTVTPPRDARVIDGRGKYLIPGLADMHTHLFSDGPDVPDSVGAAELGVMLANGVTVARIMIGQPRHHELRDRSPPAGSPGRNSGSPVRISRATAWMTASA